MMMTKVLKTIVIVEELQRGHEPFLRRHKGESFETHLV